jgi:hypothetical protein
MAESVMAQPIMMDVNARQLFDDYVRASKRSGRLTLFIEPDPLNSPGVGVFASIIFELLADDRSLVPADVATALKYSAPTSYAEAVAAVNEVWVTAKVTIGGQTMTNAEATVVFAETFAPIPDANDTVQ